jgi:3-hydroxybutyryl-CoA dehydrogenase
VPPAGEVPRTIGVVGAGTMGAGIAQLACLQAGARTLLHDPVGEALARGVEAVEHQLDRGAERGRWSAEDAAAARERLEAAERIEELAACELVIEAAPESLTLKHELYEQLSRIVEPGCVLATNTSSLPVTAIASAATGPERVVGMHFFNPAPVMRLVEVIAGDASGEDALAVARATGEAMGKRVIDAADGPGFLVNRCGRPFGLEALRLLQERIATVEQIDRIVRLGGGFRMGPFELMDLVGVDTGFDVSRSFYELSFGEPRWRPSTITARLVAAGRFGRKTGRGYYDYRSGPHRPEDPEPPAGSGGDGRAVVVAGHGVLAGELRHAAQEAGFRALERQDADADAPWLIVDCGADPDDPPLQGAPQAILCAEGSLAALDPGGAAAGFHALPPFESCRLVELTSGPATADAAGERAEELFAALGKHTERVGDAPGLVLGRIVCQLVNEAAFALREGVGSAEDIDAGMLLGLNYPHGPLHWADVIGLDHVLAVLDALADEYREERYRPAPLLRHHVWAGRLGHATGAGFFEHGS